MIGLGTFGFDSAVCYLYENKGPKNVLLKHPTRDDTRFFLLRTGEADGTGTWFKERRNIYQDFRKAFGREPEDKGLIVMQIDSDNTSSAAEVFYRELYQRKK